MLFSSFIYDAPPSRKRIIYHKESSMNERSGKVDQESEKSVLRVGLATSGRFHLLDVARALAELGADVRFYSYVSRKRAVSFGLPARCHVGLLPVLFPLVAWERLAPRFFPNIIERLMCWALDLITIVRMQRCDIFVCMSGLYLLAAKYAKWRYGALIHVHRSKSSYFVTKGHIAAPPRRRTR